MGAQSVASNKASAFRNDGIVGVTPAIGHGPGGYELENLGEGPSQLEELAKPRSKLRLFAVLLGLNVWLHYHIP